MKVKRVKGRKRSGRSRWVGRRPDPKVPGVMDAKVPEDRRSGRNADLKVPGWKEAQQQAAAGVEWGISRFWWA